MFRLLANRRRPGMIRQNDIGAGALDAGEDFEVLRFRRASLLRGGDHGVFAADVVGSDRHENCWRTRVITSRYGKRA